ncbi:MAG: hypothetical protein ABIJ09_10410 [Pseudomonadota bacterium]
MLTKLIAGMLGAAAVAAATTFVVLRSSAGDDGNLAGAVVQVEPVTPAKTDDSGAMKQSIAIKGHWQIEVRNPDGTVTQRREFDNAFVGALSMQELMQRQNVIGAWHISLYGVGANPASACMATNPEPCVIREPQPPAQEDTRYSFNLSLTPSTSGVRFSGSKVASRDGVVGRVDLGYTACPGNNSPESCAAWNVVQMESKAFTAHALTAGQEISLITGQQILVSVEVSFLPAN